MKKIIMDVLHDFALGETNISSETARETIANMIVAAIKSQDDNNYVYSGDMVTNKINANSPYNDGWTQQHYKNKLSEQIVENKDKKYIYESPDGGKTIYRREFGKTLKEQVGNREEYKGGHLG